MIAGIRTKQRSFPGFVECGTWAGTSLSHDDIELLSHISPLTGVVSPAI